MKRARGARHITSKCKEKLRCFWLQRLSFFTVVATRSFFDWNESFIFWPPRPFLLVMHYSGNGKGEGVSSHNEHMQRKVKLFSGYRVPVFLLICQLTHFLLETNLLSFDPLAPFYCWCITHVMKRARGSRHITSKCKEKLRCFWLQRLSFFTVVATRSFFAWNESYYDERCFPRTTIETNNWEGEVTFYYVKHPNWSLKTWKKTTNYQWKHVFVNTPNIGEIPKISIFFKLFYLKKKPVWTLLKRVEWGYTFYTKTVRGES